MFRPMYSKQVFVVWTPFGFISVFLSAALLKLEITVSFLWLSLPVHSGSLKRIKYSKLYSLTHTFLLNVFSAFKGTRFYILFYLMIVKLTPSEFYTLELFSSVILSFNIQYKLVCLSVCISG